MRFYYFSLLVAPKRETGVLSTATFQIGNIIIPRQRQSVSIESRRTNISLEMILKMDGWRRDGWKSSGDVVFFRWPSAPNHRVSLLWRPASLPRPTICCSNVVKHVIQSPFPIGIFTQCLSIQVRLAYGRVMVTKPQTDPICTFDSHICYFFVSALH